MPAINETELHRGRTHEGLRAGGTHEGLRANGTHEGLRSPSHTPANGFDTPSSRAMRIALARAFPVRIAPMREVLVSGSITKLARP